MPARHSMFLKKCDIVSECVPLHVATARRICLQVQPANNPVLRPTAAADNAAMRDESPKAESLKRKCRHQFSLRTLMVVVTLVAIASGYVGQQYQIIHDRKRFLDDHFHQQKLFGIDDSIKVEVPWIRQLLGDEGVWKIGLNPQTDKAERERVAALFPEAEVQSCRLRRRPEIGIDVFDFEIVPFPSDDSPAQPRP
jgi:hypothetical protein